MQSYSVPSAVRKRGRPVLPPKFPAPRPAELRRRQRRARSSPVFDDKTIDAALLTVLDKHIAR